MSGEHPFDLFVRRWQERGGKPRVASDRARGLCPYHRDTRPSLGVKRREFDILFNCFFCGKAGKGKILRALGLTERDLFTGPLPFKVKAPVIVAMYDYENEAGVSIAQKVRTASKQFWFRRADPNVKGGWRNDLKGVSVGLYRIRDVIDRPVVYVTEGEKGTDRLWQAGIPATCGPFGAGKWLSEWSRTLWTVGCRELVVLADNDVPGAQHAELVARVTSELHVDERVSVKVVHFVDLPNKADVVDFLETHSVAELVHLVAGTPAWFPGSIESAQLNRRRILTRDRVRRHRERKRASLRGVTGRSIDIRGVTESVPNFRTVTAVTLEAVTPHQHQPKSPPHSELVAVTDCERSSNTLLSESVEGAGGETLRDGG